MRRTLFVAGLIGKPSPESVRFETTTASIGVRGTGFALKTREPRLAMRRNG